MFDAARRRMIARRWMALAHAPLLCLACLAAVQPARADAAETTTVFYDAQIFTAEHGAPYAEALAIRGERILAVGTRAAVDKAAGPSAQQVDLHGKFLMPGMIDAHAHPIDGGLTLIEANFPDTSDSVPALAQFVAEHAAKKDSLRGDVLVIRGLDIGYWSHLPDLEAAFSSSLYAKLPIVLFGSDGHTAWGNTLARRRAGITAAYIRALSPTQRRFYGADAAFNSNGFVVDAGETKLERSLPVNSPAKMLEAAHAAVGYMNGLGITAWLDAQVSGVVGGDIPARLDDPGYITAYRDIGMRGELTAHVVGYPVVLRDADLSQIDVVEALRDKYKNIPNFAIPGLKIFADGVVETPSQTAALTKPYVNSGTLVKPLFTPAKMNALVSEAVRRGLAVHIHAIGDQAVKQSLDAFEAARMANPSTRLPLVLTHAQFVDPEDIPRFGQLHVIAALQLLWAVADPSTNEEVKPFIDPEIYRWMYPARSILDTGGEIAGASDWPVSSANPFLAIYQAETRSGPQGVLNASERMPRAAMLYAYTRNAAEVLDQLKDIGTLAPGKRADLALIDRDVFTVPADELAKATVLFTMFGGKLVYGQIP